MPADKTSRLKNPELYGALRDDGASKEKAARISKAAAKQGRSAIGHTGGHAVDYDKQTMPELKKRVKELGLSGYSRKRKSELIYFLRNH